MKIVVTMTALATALLGVVGSTSAQATDIEIYRTDHERADCRVVDMMSSKSEVSVLNLGGNA